MESSKIEELVRKYISGKMNPIEELDFEALLESNTSVAEELAFQLELTKIVMTDYYQQLETASVPLLAKSSLIQKPIKVSDYPKQNLYLAAASILLLIGLCSVLLFFKLQSAEVPSLNDTIKRNVTGGIVASDFSKNPSHFPLDSQLVENKIQPHLPAIENITTKIEKLKSPVAVTGTSRINTTTYNTYTIVHKDKELNKDLRDTIRKVEDEKELLQSIISGNALAIDNLDSSFFLVYQRYCTLSDSLRQNKQRIAEILVQYQQNIAAIEKLPNNAELTAYFPSSPRESQGLSHCRFLVQHVTNKEQRNKVLPLPSIIASNENNNTPSTENPPNLDAITDDMIIYIYDNEDRVTAITYPKPLTCQVQFTYDSNGNLSQIEDGIGNLAHFIYNDLGNLVEQKGTFPISLCGHPDRNSIEEHTNTSNFVKSVATLPELKAELLTCIKPLHEIVKGQNMYLEELQHIGDVIQETEKMRIRRGN